MGIIFIVPCDGSYMGAFKSYITDFVSVNVFQAWDKFKQWKYVDQKKDLATRLLEKEITTGDSTKDKILWRKMNRHARFYEQLIRKQDKLESDERWTLIRSSDDPCQTTLSMFWNVHATPRKSHDKE